MQRSTAQPSPGAAAAHTHARTRPPPLRRPPACQVALAQDPVDRAPGQEEPGSEDEADPEELRRGGWGGKRDMRAAAPRSRHSPAVLQPSATSFSTVLVPIMAAVIRQVRQEREHEGAGEGGEQRAGA